MTYTLNQLTHCTDVSPADWIGPRLTDWGSGVTSVVPSGFAAYTRIVHRPGMHLPDSTPVSGATTWAQVAASTGRLAHSLMQWHAIRAGHDGRPDWDGDQPDEGELDAPQLRALCTLLAQFTTSPDEAFHALWSGFGGWSSGGTVMWATNSGDMPAVYRNDPEVARLAASRQLDPVLPPEVLEGPLVELPNREYFLFSGPVAAADDFRTTSELGLPERQTPQLWWPSDKAWCVATEIDFDSTLVGGAQLIDAILAHDGIEAYRVPPDGDLTYRGDVINDPTGEISRDW